MYWASCAGPAAAGETETCDGRHKTGFAGGLVSDENQLWQASDMLDATGLQFAQRVVDVFQLLAHAAKRSVGANKGALDTLRAHEVDLMLRLGAAPDFHDKEVIILLIRAVGRAGRRGRSDTTSVDAGCYESVISPGKLRPECRLRAAERTGRPL